MPRPHSDPSIPMSALFAGLLVSCGSCRGAAPSGDSAVAVATPADASLAEASGPKGPTEEELSSYQMPYEMIEGEPMLTVLPQDAIPAIDDPAFVSAEEAMEWMDPEETVIGVVGANGTAKCYSAWLLDSHEIVNDELDGEPITATW